jgi:CRISPR/Cas system-associated exonuclease Cas4 (RecB family)
MRVVGAAGLDPVPAVLLDPDLGPGDPFEVIDEVAAQAQAEVLDLAHPVLLGEGVDGVLLGVGGDDVRVVARQVRGGEVAAQRGGHVQILDLVPVAVPGDVDQADLGLAVLVVAERDGHGWPLPFESCRS